MQLNFKELTYCVGDASVVESMLDTPALSPFSEEAMDFLNALSKILMREGRGYSDVATFAFWCRKSAVKQRRDGYANLENRLGRGIVFHSTPSNVAVNFAFSFAAGLLAGNANIVRLPAKEYAQVEIIVKAVNTLLDSDYAHMKPYVCMVKFPPVQEITDVFSLLCDTRVIWGGDNTIAELRKSAIKPRANEITFADRYSFCIIQADDYLEMDGKEKIAQSFYNDTYFSDQNACTAPRIVVWTGEKVEQAQSVFWEEIENLARKEYELAPVQAVGKWAALCKAGAGKSGIHLTDMKSCYVMRIKLDTLDSDIMEYRYNSGYFYEYIAKEIDEILPICQEKCQTVSYLGEIKQEILDFVNRRRPRGIDRVVPMGTTMDFALVWDGYDLIYNMSRKIGTAD